MANHHASVEPTPEHMLGVLLLTSSENQTSRNWHLVHYLLAMVAAKVAEKAVQPMQDCTSTSVSMKLRCTLGTGG